MARDEFTHVILQSQKRKINPGSALPDGNFPTTLRYPTVVSGRPA
jgi:hypothetical protein